VQLGLRHVARRVPGRPRQRDQRHHDRDEHDRGGAADDDPGPDVDVAAGYRFCSRTSADSLVVIP
jgi:hypothetical protein